MNSPAPLSPATTDISNEGARTARVDQLDLFAVLNGPDEVEAMDAMNRTDAVFEKLGQVVRGVTKANPTLANLIKDNAGDVDMAMYMRSGGATMEAVKDLIVSTSSNAEAVMAVVAIADATPGAAEVYSEAQASLGEKFALMDAGLGDPSDGAVKAPAKRGRKKGSGKASKSKEALDKPEGEQAEDPDADIDSDESSADPAISDSAEEIDGPEEAELNKEERQARKDKFEAAKAMQGILNALRGTRYDPPTLAEEIALGSRIQTGDAEARTELIERNTRYLVRAAARFRKTGRSLDELFQAGSFGLMRAAELFDPTKGFRFTTYADAWIRQSISRFLVNDELIRTPIHVVDKEMSHRKKAREAASAGDHALSKELLKIADEMRLDRPSAGSFAPMDDPLGGEDDRTLHDLLMSEDVSLEQAAEAKKLVTWLLRAADNTDVAMHGEIFKMRLGLHPDHENDPLTLLEISEIYKISRERVRQIFEKSMIEVAQSVVYWAKGEENLPQNFFPLLKATYGRG